MKRSRRGSSIGVIPLPGALLFVALLMAALARAGATTTRLPGRLSDAEFWSLSEGVSEPPGSFRSENFVSNEPQFQFVIPELLARPSPGDVYLGVGPEQNFSYIAAVKPRVAFVIDIRRGNLLEHLLYKAIFELSRDRAEFLSRLFSRARPAGLNQRSTVTDLFNAFGRAEPRQDLYEANVKAVIGRLRGTHHFPLSDEDLQGIRNIYRYAFFTGGPGLSYAAGGGDGGGLAPTYQELMSADDGTGVNRSYLASEQSYATVRALQTKNLIVPVVGDFAGPTAIRAIGDYARRHDATISVFYVSNVEEYLVQDSRWNSFCESVRALPLTEASTFVFSGAGAPDARSRRNAGVLETHLRPMLSDTERCETSAGDR